LKIDANQNNIQKKSVPPNDLYPFCLADASPFLPVRHSFAPTDQGRAKVKTGENAFPTRSRANRPQTPPNQTLEKPVQVQNAENNQETKVKMTPGPMLHDKGNKGRHAGYGNKEERE
jgi:hypothetical protein